MMLRLFVVAATLALVMAAPAAAAPDSKPAAPTSAPAAAKTVSREISLRSGDTEIKAWVATPAAPGPWPGVVIAFEWWGLNPQVRGVADRLAAAGYRVIVPDLYHGEVTDDPNRARELKTGLPDARAVADLTAAARWLLDDKGSAGKPVGVMGFCMGGRLALMTAASGAPVRACADFYGSPTLGEAEIAKVGCPVLGIFGADDQSIPVDSIRGFEKAMTDAGRAIDVTIYPGAGHAFLNETRANYRPEQAADAWKKLLAFLSARLAS